MANRVYLYSINKKPRTGEKLLIKDISEHKWLVPLSFEILLSGKTQKCSSFIWEDKYALIGDYIEGLKRFDRFTNLMLKNNVQHPEMFSGNAREFIQNLNSPEIKQKYFLLEVYEVLENFSIRKFTNSISYLKNCIDRNDFDALNNYTGNKDLRTHWEDMVGLDSLLEPPSVLYFSFNKEVEVA